MHSCTISELVSIVAGSPVEGCIGHDRITGGAIDSRRVQPGEIFFAMQGTARHGMLFLDEAFARGASCVITDSIGCGLSGSEAAAATVGLPAPDNAEFARRIIGVTDTPAALQELARWNRRQSRSLVIGVAGSVGKTTARQMIASVLGTHSSGSQSPHNFNNELGVPLSLLQLAPAHTFAVLELAACKSGDIRFLAELARPEFAVVTRIAASHLDSFGDIDTIRRTKQELAESVPRNGKVFLNCDDPAVRCMAASASADVVLFGTDPDASMRATGISARNGVCSFTVDSQRFSIIGGRQLVTAAMAAVAVGRVAGISDYNIARGLAEFRSDAGRGRVVLNSPWTVIDDSYNACPASVLGAVASLADWPEASRRILILGDMLELGRESDRLHSDVGQSIANSAIDHTVLCGSHADAVIRGARSAGASLNRFSPFRDLDTLRPMLAGLLHPGDVILVKGSRGMRMERILNWLREKCGEASADRSAA